MFDDRYKELVDALCNRFADWQRGTTIPWHEIEKCMGRSRFAPGGWTIIRRFARRLQRDREIEARPLKINDGLHLFTHEENARLTPLYRQKRAYRQVNKEIKSTATIPLDQLPIHLRTSLVAQRNFMKQERLSLGRAKREAQVIGKKSFSHPVPLASVLV